MYSAQLAPTAPAPTIATHVNVNSDETSTSAITTSNLALIRTRNLKAEDATN